MPRLARVAAVAIDDALCPYIRRGELAHAEAAVALLDVCRMVCRRLGVDPMATLARLEREERREAKEAERVGAGVLGR
jgi:hypothetical protein